MLTTATAALHTDLTTYATIKDMLGLDHNDDQTRLSGMIRRASGLILDCIKRPLAREVYTETVSGTGDTRLMLERTPIVAVSQILYYTTVVTDYIIDRPNAGILYRELGWYDTMQWGQDVGMLVPHRLSADARQNYSVDYTAGYLLPS